MDIRTDIIPRQRITNKTEIINYILNFRIRTDLQYKSYNRKIGNLD